MRGSLAEAGRSAPAASLARLRAPKALATRRWAAAAAGPAQGGGARAGHWLSDLAGLVPSLASPDAKDEAALQAFGEVWDSMTGEEAPAEAPPAAAPRRSSPAGCRCRRCRGCPRRCRRAESLDGGALLQGLADPDSRLRHRLPALGSLSRRFGATLLRRVAQRLEDDAHSPGRRRRARRRRRRRAERSLADIIEPAKAEAAVES